jgi:hypothetical protein
LSTVSGGGLAAAAYISSLYSHLKAGDPRRQYAFAKALAHNPSAKDLCKRRCVHKHYQEMREGAGQPVYDPCPLRHLERGYHSNMLQVLRKPRLWMSHFDRGDLLEEAFADEILAGNWLGEDLTLGQLFIPKDGPRPSLPQSICNATALENGAILPFTPKVLARYQIDSYTHRMEIVSRGTDDLLKFCADVLLALGMAASGSFPVLIPPCTLGSKMDPKNPYLHLVDGGIVDNLGTSSALSLLADEAADKKKLLLVVDAFTGEFAPFSKGEGAPGFLSIHPKLPYLPLDGWRGRHQQQPQVYADSGISIISVSFDDLYRPLPGSHEEDPQAVTRLFEELKGFGFDEPRQADETPWTIIRGVKTDYNISGREQKLLMAVGRYLVAKKAPAIREALGWQ